MDQIPLLQEYLIYLLKVIKFFKRAMAMEGVRHWIIYPNYQHKYKNALLEEI